MRAVASVSKPRCVLKICPREVGVLEAATSHDRFLQIRPREARARRLARRKTRPRKFRSIEEGPLESRGSKLAVRKIGFTEILPLQQCPMQVSPREVRAN